MPRPIHFEIQADDPARAAAFYEKTLGWKITQAMKKEDGGMDYWMIETGEKGTPGINGGLYQRPAEGEMFYLYDCTIDVADLDAAIKAVKENGGTVSLMKGEEKSEIPHVGWFASCKDTEGNRFGLMQPTEWKPS
ncbi:MAG: VOC family protein [Candidatus Paceibacterales bacterium]